MCIYLRRTESSGLVSTFRDGLIEKGHNVFVFCPDSNEQVEDERLVFRYPSIELESQKYPLTLPVSSLVNQVLPILKPDVLHANHPALLGRVAELKSKELDVPLIFTYHTRCGSVGNRTRVF